MTLICPEGKRTRAGELKQTRENRTMQIYSNLKTQTKLKGL